MSHERLNINGFFMRFPQDFHDLIMVFSPLKSPFKYCEKSVNFPGKISQDFHGF